ncbi:hypothetical protein QD47_18260 [Paenibacillus terrae]|uniref:Uncharacterized protein n=1 Tax=Paenibacillus terrae TaxID=159743 RepID=A0A0D7WZK4_9BACL|nr:hypothetical protein QD47_18260 [Paenibacillus terrae]
MELPTEALADEVAFQLQMACYVGESWGKNEMRKQLCQTGFNLFGIYFSDAYYEALIHTHSKVSRSRFKLTFLESKCLFRKNKRISFEFQLVLLLYTFKRKE